MHNLQMTFAILTLPVSPVSNKIQSLKLIASERSNEIESNCRNWKPGWRKVQGKNIGHSVCWELGARPQALVIGEMERGI